MNKKWVPIQPEQTITTDKYKYVFGIYKHDQYGNNCFRISKFLKENNYFIGHFVIVDEDKKALKDIILHHINNF